MKRCAIVLLTLATLTACAGVKGETYTSASKDKVAEDVGKSNLSTDDKREFASALIRATFGSYDPGNKTVAQIIDDERAYEKQEAAAEEATKEAAAKEAAIAAAQRRVMQGDVSVQVLSKGFEPADYENGSYEDHITLQVQFHNKSKKKISEVKGALIFTNHFGDRIYRAGVDESGFDGSALAPGAIYTATYGINYNQFMDNEQKFRNTDLSGMDVQWMPLGIHFVDGTTMTAEDTDSASSSD